MKSLTQWVHEHKDDKFEWGISDCCLFVSDYVNELHGIDPASEHRGHYSTELGAKKALVKYGSIADALDKHFSRVDNINFAKRGDLVHYVSELGDTVGIKWVGGILTIGYDGCVVVNVASDKVAAVWRIE